MASDAQNPINGQSSEIYQDPEAVLKIPKML